MAEALSFAGAGVAVTSRSLDDAQATAAETAAATSGETLGERQRYRPGPFLTKKNVAHQHSEHRVRVIGQEVALRPWGKMHEIAGAAIYLASEASSYVTGSVLTVDGGWTAH